jgi:hypothetical protein
MNGEKRNAYKILEGNARREPPLGRHRLRWKDNIKLDLRGIRWVVRTGLIWLRIRSNGRLLLTPK